MKSDTHTSRASRGQSTIDYAIGVTLFISTVAFVLGYTPVMLDPFVTGDQDTAAAADRVVEHLAGDALVADGAPPARLSVSCTNDFFAGQFPPSDPDCGYAGSSLRDAVGLDDRRRLNVTLEREGTAVRAVGESTPSTGTPLTTASRLVFYDDQTLQLVVRVW